MCQLVGWLVISGIEPTFLCGGYKFWSGTLPTGVGALLRPRVGVLPSLPLACSPRLLILAFQGVSFVFRWFGLRCLWTAVLSLSIENKMAL